MELHDLKPARNSRKARRRVGRGPGSGHGKTSGRGHKGQKSRATRGMLHTLEGGQVPLIRRIPKLGFRSHRPVLYQVINVGDLSVFKPGTVDARTLKEKGFIRNAFKPYKILGEGELKTALTVQAYAFSKTAREKIEKAGGKAVAIDAVAVKKAESKAGKDETSS